MADSEGVMGGEGGGGGWKKVLIDQNLCKFICVVWQSKLGSNPCLLAEKISNLANAGLMLAQRLRRCSNIKAALDQRHLFYVWYKFVIHNARRCVFSSISFCIVYLY